jgi:cell division protein FtsW
VTSRVPITFYKTYASALFFIPLLLTILVFVPAISTSFGGASRWIDLGIITFQPTELLKIGFVIYCAGWATTAGEDIKDWRKGALPFSIIIATVAGVLLAQPDTGSFLVIALAAGAMFIVAGARWLHISAIVGMAAGGLAVLALARPYIRERLVTFFNPSFDPLGAGYQIQQSLIAVGSGEWFGRGVGQSIQKFGFIPEPMSDAIFAVFAEELGFVGAAILVLLFLAFGLRGYTIAEKASDKFTTLLVVGLVSMITAQVFVNIGATLGLLPLTGLPLIFISQGGTALAMALISVGIILAASRKQSPT